MATPEANERAAVTLSDGDNKTVINNPSPFDLLRSWFIDQGVNSRNSFFAVCGVHVLLTTEVFPFTPPGTHLELAARVGSKREAGSSILVGFTEDIPLIFQGDLIEKIMGNRLQTLPNPRLALEFVGTEGFLKPDQYTRRFGLVDANDCSPLTLQPIPEIPAGWGTDYAEGIVETPNYLKYRSLHCECPSCSSEASLSYYTLTDARRGNLQTTSLVAYTHLPVYECGSCHEEFQHPKAVVELLVRGDSVLQFLGVAPKWKPRDQNQLPSVLEVE